jgi:PleD family two-component response regulator
MYQHRRLVLLVDGDLARARRLADRMSGSEFDIQITGNGATALLNAHQVRPDVIVAAGDAPILDGYLLVEALRSKPETADIPVLLLTEGTSQAEFARGWKAGADLCIPRSQGEADVLATLHRALCSVNHSAEREAQSLLA